MELVSINIDNFEEEDVQIKAIEKYSEKVIKNMQNMLNKKKKWIKSGDLKMINEEYEKVKNDSIKLLIRQRVLPNDYVPTESRNLNMEDVKKEVIEDVMQFSGFKNKIEIIKIRYKLDLLHIVRKLMSKVSFFQILKIEDTIEINQIEQIAKRTILMNKIHHQEVKLN